MLKRFTLAVAGLTHARLVECLNYDTATGSFTRASSGKNAGSRCPIGYIRIRIDGKAYLAHRLAWFFVMGVWPTAEIDHIDLIPSNNAFCNLREATRSENQRNTRCRNKLRLKGVTTNHRGSRYRAQISIDGRTQRLGSFDTPEEAHAAYVCAVKEVAGEFARAA